MNQLAQRKKPFRWKRVLKLVVLVACICDLNTGYGQEPIPDARPSKPERAAQQITIDGQQRPVVSFVPPRVLRTTLQPPSPVGESPSANDSRETQQRLLAAFDKQPNPRPAITVYSLDAADSSLQGPSPPGYSLFHELVPPSQPNELVPPTQLLGRNANLPLEPWMQESELLAPTHHVVELAPPIPMQSQPLRALRVKSLAAPPDYRTRR